MQKLTYPSAEQAIMLTRDLLSAKKRQFKGQNDILQVCCSKLAWIVKNQLTADVYHATGSFHSALFAEEKSRRDVDVIRQELIDLCIRLDVDNLEKHIEWL